MRTGAAVGMPSGKRSPHGKHYIYASTRCRSAGSSVFAGCYLAHVKVSRCIAHTVVGRKHSAMELKRCVLCHCMYRDKNEINKVRAHTDALASRADQTEMAHSNGKLKFRPHAQAIGFPWNSRTDIRHQHSLALSLCANTETLSSQTTFGVLGRTQAAHPIS